MASPYDRLKLLRDDLDVALAAMQETPPEPEPPEPPAIVSTPEEFDAALGSAVAGETIVCAVTLVYTAALTIRASDITIRSEHEGNSRMTAQDPAPSFMGAVRIEGANVTLVGLALSNSKLVDILVLVGAGAKIDRCRILGDPIDGSKRGIAANAADVLITRCFIDDCFGSYPGNDTQAICAWDTPGPITITDNYLCGGSETIMFGGSDPSCEANVPADILIANNTITKDPAWQSMPIGVKNTLELKNARRVRIVANEISYSWGGHGQDGYLLMLTPRNQNGGAPYSTIEDVLITDNIFRCAAAAINILGTDDNQPCERMTRVTIQDNRFEELDPKLYAGSNKMIQISDGPTQVTIDANQFEGEHIGSQIYFNGAPPCEDLIVTDNVFPASTYGVFGNNCSTGNGSNGLPNAWNTYVASGTYAGNTTTPAADKEVW